MSTKKATTKTIVKKSVKNAVKNVKAMETTISKPKVEKPIIEVKSTTKKAKATIIADTKVSAPTKKSNAHVSKERTNGKILGLLLKECKKSVKNTKDEKKLLHHDVCLQLNELREKTKFPIGTLVYIAIGTSAHKPSVFNEGYTAIHTTKANRIIGYCKSVAKAFGNPSLAWNDKVVHAMYKYDKTFTNGNYKVQFLKECLGKMTIKEGFKFSQFKTAKELVKFIFGDALETAKNAESAEK